MTTFSDTLLLNIKIISAQANTAIDRTTKRLSMLQKKANLATNLKGLRLGLNKFGQIIDPVTKKFVSGQEIMRRQVEQTIKKTSSGMRDLRRNMLGFGLSMLFTGMAIKRLGDNILKSLVKTYMTATDEQSKFNRQLMGVQASFEFLKFSIMDALGQSDLVIGFIDGIIQLTNRISAFISTHPKVALLIGLFTGIAVVGGGLLMVIGQTTLAIIGLIAGYELLRIAMIQIKGIAIIKWLTSLKVASWLAFWPYLLIIAAIGFLIFQFIKLKEVTGSWKNAFKAAGLGILFVVALIGDGILEFILIPINLAIAAINLLIAGWNRLAGTKFGRKFGIERVKPLEQLPTFILSGKVKEAMDDLAYEVAIQKALEKEREEDKAKGDVNVIVNGDVSDAFLIDKITDAMTIREEELKVKLGVTEEVD